MKIAVLKGCRSDLGLINPILKRLKEDKQFFEVDEVKLVPSDYYVSYAKMDWYLKYNTPDLVIIPADRIEMMAGATCCFLFGIPIAHIYGGVTNQPLSTVDDTFRHNISLMSELIFVENSKAMHTVHGLFYSVDRSVYTNPNLCRIKIIGNLYMCDYEVDENLVPTNPYDTPYYLILYNGKYNGNDWATINLILRSRPNIVIGGNPDTDENMTFLHSENLIDVPRSKFLGLLKHCQRFITNSSSAYYEAPTFLRPEQIKLIGERNKNRSSTDLPEGKPDIVIETIKEWYRKR